MNIQNLVLDINKKCNQLVTANVGEVDSRLLKISVIDNGVPMNLTGITVYLYAKKADGTKVFNTVKVEDAKQGIVSAEITSQVLAIEGFVKLTLLLTKDKARLASKIFTLKVDETIVDDEALESSNEFKALDLALDKVDEWNGYFEETSGKIEEKYTERLNQVDSQLAHIANEVKIQEFENDSLKIKNAINKAKEKNKNFIEFTYNEYIIDEPIIVDVEYFNFIGLSQNDNYTVIRPSENFEGDCLIDVRKTGFTIKGIKLKGFEGDINSLNLKGIKFNLEIQDTDSFILNCMFVNFNKAIECYGRNLRIKNNFFSNCFVSIDINKLNKDLSNIWGTSLRGYDIQQNIFHSNGTLNFTNSPCLVCINDVDVNQDIKFINNTIEQGVNTVIKGYHYGLKVLNNNILSSPIGKVFDFVDTPSSITQPMITIIDGNNMRGGINGIDLSTEYFIKDIDLVNFSICNNVLFGMSKGFVLANKINNSVIKNNIIDYVCSVSNLDVISINGDISNTIIKNNSVLSKHHRHGISCSGVVSNSNIIDNDILAGSGLSVYLNQNQGGSFYQKSDEYKNVFMSADLRGEFNGMTLSTNNYNKQNSNNTETCYVQETAKLKVSGGKIYPGKEFKFKNTDNSTLETKLSVFSDLISVDTEINYKGRRIYVDSEGFLKVSLT